MIQTILNDHLGLILILVTISIFQLIALSKFKKLNKVQKAFISIGSSPFMFLAGIFGIGLVICDLGYKAVVLLGGADLKDFESELEEMSGDLED